jgi:hypothetical protein
MNYSFFQTFTIWQDFKFLGRIFTSLDQKLTSVSVGRIVGAADGSFVVATAEVASRSGHSSRNWNYRVNYFQFHSKIIKRIGQFESVSKHFSTVSFTEN